MQAFRGRPRAAVSATDPAVSLTSQTCGLANSPADKLASSWSFGGAMIMFRGEGPSLRRQGAGQACLVKGWHHPERDQSALHHSSLATVVETRQLRAATRRCRCAAALSGHKHPPCHHHRPRTSWQHPPAGKC